MSTSDVESYALQMAHGGLTYSDSGEGVPIVAVHGLPGSARDFRRLAEWMPQVRMIRLNLPGFAGSAPLPRASDWRALVSTVAQAARKLAGGPFVLLGHSFGGMIALRVAAESPDARGLALLAPVGLRVHRMVRMLGPRAGLRALRRTDLTKQLFYRGLAQTGMGAHATREESDRTLALLSTLDYEPSREAARALRIPVFGAWCRDDTVVENEVVEELLRELNVQRRLSFERGGHAPQREHAREIADALTEFASACVSSALAS